ncbi:putative phage-type endonuclease [Salmonella enterica subsp. enterica]|nr:putative phage-type endonuclease [Salmonella enterica subsp. enterica]
MEPYVIDLLSEETGLEIIHRGNRYIHRDYGFIAAEIDAEAASGENIEIKTVSPFKAKEWGEVQTDAIPVHYTAQAMHGLMVTGKQVCVFGVLIGGDDFRIYRVERDEETIQAILEKEIAFWDRVINLNPPEATTVSDISLMFEKDAGSSIEADGKALALFNDLRDMKSRYKSLGEEIAVSEEKLKLYMQEHSILTLDGKTICTWKSQVSNRFDKKLFQVEHPELYEKFKTSTTSRVFRMK